MIVKLRIYYPPLLCAGETIELLDIGLRHSKDHNAVHRVKPSASTHRFSVTSPSKTLYGSGVSKSTITLLHYIRDSAETINLRGSQDSSLELSPAPPERPSSFAVHNGISFVGSNPPTVSSPDRSRALASVPLAIKPLSNSERKIDTTHKRAVSIGSPQDIHVAASSFLPLEHLPSKVPPPFLAAKSSTSVKGRDETDQDGVVEDKLFVVKSAGLQRKKAMKSSSPRSKQKQSPKNDRKLLEPPVVPEVGQPGDDNTTLLRSNMTRSFRYRKITLRHEKPLFVNKQDGADSSDEEGENENGGANGTINEEDVAKVSPDFAVEQSSTSEISTRHGPSAGSSPPRVLCKVKANQGYSKVKLGGLKSPEALSENGSKSGSISEPKLSLVGSVPEDKDGENQTTEERVIPSPVSPDVFELPARPPSDSFLYNSVTSLNSLDNILVYPPAMFDSDDKGERGGTSSELRRNDEQTSNPNSTADRNSTESNDTGYTSSASPGYHDRHKLSVADEYDEDSELPEIRDTFQQASQTEQSQTSTLSSASTDNIRQYVPLVFFCPRVGKDASLFAVQVCLVENSDELVKVLNTFYYE